ncbi:benzoate 4-monooxygenase cytochrome P450 [Penicillium argentinense]|uniref:Benzoate 4-monooxygenase cytochrome P450 n=1 Tax=Penicillium argentinense TaxID=1131581 RepID=A0A9W9FGU2_9EURO|nr:benzoate 4-monooxygenase cytochrome P450 [Penicillium argentinense]KAJ5099918.1 benzoate 4-monooxygenase cytochrome P450 [Penicillium argentinense]
MLLQRAWLVLLGLATLFALRSIYRLFFHPLRKIPGPKLAAITHVYEFYYNCVRDGRYIFQIEKMHQKYGPIVRITPNEVHIIDPFFYDEIYAASSRRRDKSVRVAQASGVLGSMVATVPHDHHRIRRGILSEFFSRRSILTMTPIIDKYLQKLGDRLGQFHNGKTVIRLDNALNAFTSDIITEYCYGNSWGFLDDENFRSDTRSALLEVANTIHLGSFFPWLIVLIRKIPIHLLRRLQPGKATIFEAMEAIFNQAASSMNKGKQYGIKTETSEKRIQQNMFDKLISPDVPAEERTLERLQDEGLLVLGAGTETVAHTLTTSVFYLSLNTDVLYRLREELKQKLPTPTSTVSLLELERLPYLTAVVYESLRLAYGPLIRMPRIAPTESLRYGEYVIPPGTPMSSITYFIHRDPTLFPNPDKFDPKRWLQGAQSEDLKRYIVNFTKGSRACLGITLAYAEIYKAIAGLARRFDFDLHGTTIEDIKPLGERVFVITRRGQTQVYVTVTDLDKA